MQFESFKFVGTWNVWGRGEVLIGFWWGNLREGDHLEDPGVDERIILIWVFENWFEEACTGLRWLRIRTGGRSL
jgi:hypothetical protein